jgi:hypothetical protein
MRQAVVLGEERGISLVLSSPSAEARTANARAFEQTLRSLRSLSPAELGGGGSGSAAPTAPAGSAAGASAAPIAVDAGTTDATPVTITPAAAAELPAPTPKQNPVGPCTR